MVDMLASPVKDWMPAIIAGVASFGGLIWSLRHKRKSEERADHRAEMDRLRELEMTSEATHAQDLTARFRALMEGYENRIKELTVALAVSTAEARRLAEAYEERAALCNTCPTYAELLRTRDARPTH